MFIIFDQTRLKYRLIIFNILFFFFCRPDYIDYVKFGETVEEAVTTGSLERAPLLVPVQHVPSEASPKTFLNFEERHMATVAIDKLSRLHQPNLEELFKVCNYTNTIQLYNYLKSLDYIFKNELNIR